MSISMPVRLRSRFDSNPGDDSDAGSNADRDCDPAAIMTPGPVPDGDGAFRRAALPMIDPERLTRQRRPGRSSSGGEA